MTLPSRPKIYYCADLDTGLLTTYLENKRICGTIKHTGRNIQICDRGVQRIWSIANNRESTNPQQKKRKKMPNSRPLS